MAACREIYQGQFAEAKRVVRPAGNGSDPRAGLIRVAIFMAAASTLIGFGTMAFADHRLLRSAGFSVIETRTGRGRGLSGKLERFVILTAHA